MKKSAGSLGLRAVTNVYSAFDPATDTQISR